MATAISVAHDQWPARMALAGDSVFSSEIPSPGEAPGKCGAICGNAAEAPGVDAPGPAATGNGGTPAEAPGRSGTTGARGTADTPPGPAEAPGTPPAPAEALGAGRLRLGCACPPTRGLPTGAAARE